MKTTPLKKFLAVKGNSQGSLAERVGLTQGAISKMVRTDRNVDVVEHDDGRIELVERRTIGGTPAAA